jgi:hypothetical protein
MIINSKDYAMLKTKYCFAYIAIVSVLLSCKKSETFDVTGNKQVKFFTNNTASGNAPDNSISYSVVNIPDVAGNGLVNLSTNLPAAIKFPVFATRPVSQDVVIGAELDNSFIAKYNSAHGTSYAAFPAGVLNTTSLMAHLVSGNTSSTDSVTIQTNLALANSMSEKTYMAPIRLTTVSNEGAGVITDNSTSQIVYIVANVELRRIKYLATTADVMGTLVSPRTAWTATFSPAPATTGSILDGSTTTFSRWAASPGILDVNMQVTKNVTGLRLYTTTSTTLIPTQVEVYLSNDGINYDFIGAPLRANLTFATNYNYILFYKAIPAKYIRLKLSYSTSTNTQNLRVTEFDVYAN